MNIKTKKTLSNIALLLTIILVCFVFSYHLKKQMPSGVDATNYIPAAQWIEKTGNVPDTYEPIQLSFSAYTSPLPSLNLAILQQFSGINITYPFFSILQMIILIFLCLTTYLVGSTYNKIAGIFSMLFLVISEGISFLFTSSTIANLLALSFINILFFSIYQFQKNKSKKNIVLFLIFFTALFFVHRQLTFPLFLVVFPLYCVILFFKSKETIKIYFTRIIDALKRNKLILVISLIILATIIGYIGYKIGIYLYSIIAEWYKAYVIEDRSNKFSGLIMPSDWFKYFGMFFASFSIFGIIIVIKKITADKKYNFYLFPIIWIAVALLLSLINYFGVSFEAMRWIYQSYIFMALFAGIAVSETLIALRDRKIIVTSVATLILVIIINQGIYINKIYSDRTNFVTEDDIDAFKIAYENSKYGDKILINKNPLDCGYDKLLVNMERIFDYSLGVEASAKNEDALINYMNDNNIKIIIVRKENFKNNSELDNMNNIKKIYQNNVDEVYELSL